MARSLNKNRIRDTKLALIVCFFTVIFTTQLFPMYSHLHVLFDIAGNILITICIVGRVYTTAFLGGQKNATLITYGPFSITRNPLYFFSFIGACGIGLMSNHLTLMALVPIAFCIVFFNVIRREEAFLRDHFGDTYVHYCATTPKFFPRFSRYYAPEEVPMKPAYLIKALKDGAFWLLAFPLYEIIELLQMDQIIHTWFTLF